MLTGRLYDWLKWIAQIVLPAFGTLYFTLAGIWGLPSANEIVGTVMAVDLFLGVLLGISTASYNKQIASGVMNVEETPVGEKFTLELDEDPSDLSEKKEARFQIQDGG